MMTFARGMCIVLTVFSAAGAGAFSVTQHGPGGDRIGQSEHRLTGSSNDDYYKKQDRQKDRNKQYHRRQERRKDLRREELKKQDRLQRLKEQDRQKAGPQ